MIKLNNKKGFTLIELMIVIAIIGILAAIAIPNFIAYRNKSYCSRAESDANNLAAALSDHFSIPSNTTLPVIGNATGQLKFVFSGDNTGTIGGTVDAIVITVTDKSGKCPANYRTSQAAVPASFKDGWTGFVHYKYMGR
jgi:type IV pilus assembly protein PilA